MTLSQVLGQFVFDHPALTFFLFTIYFLIFCGSMTEIGNHIRK